VAHGRRTARWVRGLTGGVGEREQGRARPGYGSQRWDRWQRGGATRLKITSVAVQALGRRGKLGGLWGTIGRGGGPFIEAERGHIRARKGETTDDGGGIKGVQLNVVCRD
jgi:hypothetical protein